MRGIVGALDPALVTLALDGPEAYRERGRLAEQMQALIARIPAPKPE